MCCCRCCCWAGREGLRRQDGVSLFLHNVTLERFRRMTDDGRDETRRQIRRVGWMDRTERATQDSPLRRRDGCAPHKGELRGKILVYKQNPPPHSQISFPFQILILLRPPPPRRHSTFPHSTGTSHKRRRPRATCRRYPANTVKTTNSTRVKPGNKMCGRKT